MANRALKLLRDRLRLQEQPEVVAPTGLAVGTRHVEPAERVDSHERTRALAVDIEVSRMEAFLGLGNARPVAPEVRTREPVLARVREVACLGDAENGPEDLLSEDARRRLHVVENGRLNEVAGSAAPRPAGPELRLAPPRLDVVRHGLELALGGDGAHEVLSVPRRPDGEPRGAGDDRVDEALVKTLVHDGARAGRALLALETEGRGNDLRDREVEVRVLVHDDEVLSTHLENGALDPALAVRDLRRLLMDAEAHRLRAREGDEARRGSFDEEVADVAARSREVIQDAVGHAGLLEEQ